MAIHEQASYGQVLSVVDNAGIGGCMNVAIAGPFLYAIQNNMQEKSRLPEDEGEGSLYVLTCEDPAHPAVIGKLSGLGNARQIEICGNLALVTAREDGLFIIDIADPATPRLLVHYDTIEFATGIACYGTLAMVACRQYGVEMIDISNPQSPRHVGIARVGEAQSMDASNGYLYAGVWGSHEVVVCDIRDPAQPRQVSTMELDGRGDGVFVMNGLCYIATGHHGRAMKQQLLSDPDFGWGNGLEIYDVHDPLNPRFLSRLKLKKRFYYNAFDMWSVQVSGSYAYLAHTFNGMFVIDVGNPEQPEFIAHADLPIYRGDSNYRDMISNLSRGKAGAKIVALSFDPEQLIYSPIGGLAVAHDYIYLAGGYSDLHTVYAPSLAEPIQSAAERRVVIESMPSSPKDDKPAMGVNSTIIGQNEIPAMKVYRPDGQVYAVAQADRIVYAACGAAGIHVVDLAESPVCLAVYPTNGFASDIKPFRDLMFVAEGSGGLSIWRTHGTELELISRYTANGLSIKQVILSDDGRYAILHVGGAWLYIVNISNRSEPRLELKENLFPSLIYGRQICLGLVEGRYAGCFWNSKRICWYDLGEGVPKLMPWKQDPLSLRDGFIPTKHGVLAVRAGQYVCFDPRYEGEFDDLPHYGVPGVKLTGKPTVDGEILFVADRINGHVTLLDISDIRNPQLLKRFTIEGNPDLITCNNGRVIIPAGNQGMLIFSLKALVMECG
jgi:hypothetical protein